MNLQVMAATLVVLAIVLFLLARLRKRTGIPAGEVFYQDLPGQPFLTVSHCDPTCWASPVNQTAWCEPRTALYLWN
jgi:hypothetical protein